MNQRELIKVVSNRTGAPRSSVKGIVECLADVISDTIIEGDIVSITKLGTFSKKEKESRIGYDVYRAKSIYIPGSIKITFHTNKYLKGKLSKVSME